MLAEQLLCGDIEDVIKAVIKAAKEGDMTAAKLILERICPPPRGSDAVERRMSIIERALGIESQELGRMPQVIEGEEVN